MIALPVRESCPGGPSADEGGDTERVPQGVPEVGCGCGQCLKWVWLGLNCDCYREVGVARTYLCYLHVY